MGTLVALFTTLNLLIPITATSSYEDVAGNVTTNVLNVCCSDKNWSCKQECGYAHPFVCSCHPSCALYGNCCEDFQEQCPDHYNDASLILAKHRDIEVSCHPHFWRLVVSSCPNGTTDLEAQRRCTSDTPESFLDVVYITDSESAVDYKNIYCYRCNTKSNTSRPKPRSFIFKLNNWPDLDNLSVRDLWQMMTESGAVMVLGTSDENKNRGKSMACMDKPQNSCNGCECQDSLTSTVNISKDTIYRIYRNKHCRECKIEKSNMNCGFTNTLEVPQRVHVNTFYYDTTQEFTMQFIGVGVYDWEVMECNMDLSGCRKTCPETIPLINGFCNHDFKNIYILIKVRAISGNRNELQDLTDAERNATILKIIETEYFFNHSIPWHVLDRSGEATLWAVCVELSSYYRLPKSPFNKQLLKTSMSALVSDVTMVLKHAPDNRTAQICRELSYTRTSRPSFECDGTLEQVFVVSEKDVTRSKAVSQKQKQTQVMLYFTIAFVFYLVSI